MNTLVKCDACGQPFDIVTAGIRTATRDEYEVKYVTCPHCLHRFNIITTDKELRDLISKRTKLIAKVDLARQKYFSPKTIAKYRKEIEALNKEQVKMKDALHPIGTEILRKFEG